VQGSRRSGGVPTIGLLRIRTVAWLAGWWVPFDLAQRSSPPNQRLPALRQVCHQGC